MSHDGLEMIDYRDDPAVLVFADNAAAFERIRSAAHLAGCRIAVTASIEAAADRIEGHAGVHPLFIEISGDGQSPAVVDLLDRARAEGERGRPSVVAAPAALVDLVAARCWPSYHLCEPSDADRAAALALVTRRRTARLHDIGREGHALLQQLSEEVGRIANILASLSEEEAEALGSKPAEAGEEGEPPVDAASVRAIIRARRLRDQFFRGELFADPAWDMLLDLLAARLEKARVAVSSLCIAAAVPSTTALRWIKALTERGLFVRVADPQDGRRVYIELSDEAARALTGYFRAVQRLAPAVI